MSTQSPTLLDDRHWERRIYTTDGWVSAPDWQVTVEPATGEALGAVGVADQEVVARAASDAAAAQPSWAELPHNERAAVLRRAAQLLGEHADEISHWIVTEGGSTRPKAQTEVAVSAAECVEAGGLCSQPNGVLLPPLAPGRASAALRVPVGVVGVIAPWNFPLALAMRSVAPALALGNSVILKSDPNTPVSGGVVVAEVFAAAGLPAGVLHVFTGGPEVGEAMTSDPHIQMISFTGSTVVGRRVGAAAGHHLKRVALELGGNNPFIVLSDADLDAAASAGAWGSFLHQGQICLAAGRHIVHESVLEEYLARLTERAARLQVGDPARSEVALGPLINEPQAASVQRTVDETSEAGATVLIGGRRTGLFFPATVIRDVTPGMPAWSREIFGPVAPVTSFSTDAEAIDLANDTEFGLSAAIQSASPERARRLARGLRAGMIHINDQTVNDAPNVPFSGVRASGNGIAFGGPANLEAFTEWQWLTDRPRATAFPY